MKIKVWASWSYGRNIWCYLFGHILHGRDGNVPTGTKVNQWALGSGKGIETPVFIKCDRCHSDIRALHLIEAKRDDSLDIA